MDERIARVLSEVAEALQASEGPDAAIGLGLLCVAMALLRRRGQAAPAGDPQEWVTPEAAVAEFRLGPEDQRRLYRRWRRLDYCRPHVTGGRGFEVNRRMLAERLWRGPLGGGGRFGGGGATTKL